jgi:hypothetical protein
MDLDERCPGLGRGRGPSRGRLTLLIALTAPWFLGLGLTPLPARAQAHCGIPAAAGAAQGLEPAKAATPAAGPGIIQIEGTAPATPASLPAATPIAALEPAEALKQELTAVSEALAACLSAGKSDTIVALAGERYLGQLFGSSVPMSKQEYVASMSGVPPVPTRIVSVTDVVAGADGRATANVTQIVGNQLLRAQWLFERAPADERRRGQTTWRLAAESRLPAPAPSDAATIDVGIGDRAFTLSQATIHDSDVVLRGNNTSNEDHEMLVLRFAPGFTTEDLLRASGPDLPKEVTYIGELPVRATGRGDLVLTDLERGTYHIVCLFLDADGTPHLADGMEATFTVT